MASRLFQEVREKRGLVYSVASFRSGYADAGMLGVYAGTLPDKADTTIEVIQEVLAEVAKNGLTDDEVVRAKGQLRGSTVLDSEDPGSRMSRLADTEILTGAFTSLDDTLEMIELVTSEQVARVAAHLLTQPQTLTVVGPYESDRTFGSGE
jgi:predicted Zn-dependent peptidase